jgi:hypothetical protein
MPHTPDWHIISDVFQNSDAGLTTPVRILGSLCETPVALAICPEEKPADNVVVVDSHGLRITNLDRTDPPGYSINAFPRTTAFNNNSYSITADAQMPAIPVRCKIENIDLTSRPIHWRLQCRHVLCRHANQGSYQYSGVCDILEDEWQGRSSAAEFTLFDSANANVRYDYNTTGAQAPVMGGHAILSIAASPSESKVILLDYVHLRISGTNPVAANVLAYIDAQLATRDANIRQMLRAVFAHESNFTQFKATAQTSANMTFRQKHHSNNTSQPDCTVNFNWPDDPPLFPLATFDFGVGISQYTRIGGRVITREIAWDWRENIRNGINIFLRGLGNCHKANYTWREWAWEGYRRYNGSGPQAVQYANALQASADGQLVATSALPTTLNANNETAALPAPAARQAPPAWPPF